MELFYYRTLSVYQNAKKLAQTINTLLRTFPKEELFALTAQLRRASTSVMFNIAEGFGRYTNKERIRFLDIANGSLMETSSELELAESFGYIDHKTLSDIDQDILVIVKQLSKLRLTLQTENNKES